MLAIGNGAGYLENKIYGQLNDSFIVVGTLTNGYLASYLIIAILIGQMPFLATIVASEIVSGEYSKGTFRMYLSRPVSRKHVLVSKLIVVIFYTILMMFFYILYLTHKLYSSWNWGPSSFPYGAIILGTR